LRSGGMFVARAPVRGGARSRSGGAFVVKERVRRVVWVRGCVLVVREYVWKLGWEEGKMGKD
jgi:hypothetical protein